MIIHYKHIYTPIYLGILISFLLNTSCSKKGDTEYQQLVTECWQINNWAGLESDSMLRIDTLLNIPAPNSDYVSWLSKKENHIQIRSLVSENFEDLKCLDQYLEGIKIIQLGESNHGTKEYNLIKVRLIKYLHEVHGFNIIAFESGFFDCAMANLNAEETSVEETLLNSIFDVWKTEEVALLFYYMKYGTNFDLKLAGFDCQDLYKNNNKYNRAQLLKEYASYIDPDYANQLYLDNLEVTFYTENPDSLALNRIKYKQKLNNAVSYLQNNYSTIVDSSQNGSLLNILIHSLINTRAYIDKIYYANVQDSLKSYGVRDSAMASNIVYLFEEMYPNEKIIIWAHNAHINYDLDNHNTFLWEGLRPMGNWLYEYYFNEIYTIALYSLRGVFGWDNNQYHLVLPTNNNSIESICYGVNKRYLFFDIKNHPPSQGNEWFDNLTYARQFDKYFDEIYLRKEFDGVVFIDKISIPDYTY